jgi:hypothetical protein
MLPGDPLHGQRDRRIVEADRHPDLPDIEPFARDRSADVRLVLVIRGQDLDRTPDDLAPQILDRHARRRDGARTAEIGIDPGLVVQHADFQRIRRSHAP